HSFLSPSPMRAAGWSARIHLARRGAPPPQTKVVFLQDLCFVSRPGKRPTVCAAMKIVITHERSLMSVALRHGLERDGGDSIGGEVQGADATIALVRATDPDVVLLESGPHPHEMLALLRELHARCPDVTVVVCSMPSQPVLIRLVLSSGACACLLKSINPKDIACAIRHAVNRTAFHAAGLPAIDEDDTVRLVGLTTRQAQVMQAGARRVPDPEIAGP